MKTSKPRPQPNDPRLHKVVLTFTILVEKGAIDSARMLDAAAVAAEALGVERGEILSGARLGLSFPSKDKTRSRGHE